MKKVLKKIKNFFCKFARKTWSITKKVFKFVSKIFIKSIKYAWFLTKKLLSKLKRIYYMHYICFAISVCCILFSIFVFPNAIIRLRESFLDLWNSLKFYVKELFELKIDAYPTVNEYSSVPAVPVFGLPETWEEFQQGFSKFWSLFFTWSNVQDYFSNVSNFMFDFSRILLVVVVPVVLILILLINRYLSKRVINDNHNSKPLRFWNWCVKWVYFPVVTWFLRFIDFVKEHNLYWKIWLVIWLYNFNIFTILLEFFAFYLYFVVTFSAGGIYRQVYKLFCDLTVVIAFVPTVIWVIISLLIFNKIRRNIGYNGLYHNESKDCGFINERPIVIMACGSMGKKKTTLITDMALSENVILRDTALDKMFAIDVKFPNFPWINLERFVRDCIDRHYIYSLATAREVIDNLIHYYELSLSVNDIAVQKSIKRHFRRYLKRNYNYSCNDLLFDYDLSLYPFTYYDELSEITIWDAIKDYTQLFVVYLKETFIIANLSVRSSSVQMDDGNFVLWDDDFFKRDNRYMSQFSTYSKILPFDALRLGKKLFEDNPYKDVFEFGVVVITEIGKERKNNLELQGKKKNDEETNQKTDGFNDWLKMVRHSATIDGYPFVKVISDEQRPESWGADARDLCEIIYIDESSEPKLTMPFFFMEELFYDFVYKRFMNLYYKYRFNRSDNTLFMHLLKKVSTSFIRFYTRTYNLFGYYELTTLIEKGTQDGEKKQKSYYLSKKKIHSQVFSTDCFNGFFTEKALRSKVGFDDLPNYAGVKATLEELLQQNSYFVLELVRRFKENN